MSSQTSWKIPIVVLLHLNVKLLHPPNLDEKFGEISIGFLEYSLLHAVPELVVAVLFPKAVNGFEVCFRDELDLREEDIASILSGLASEDDEEAAGFLPSARHEQKLHRG